MLGKVPPQILSDLVLSRTGASDPAVYQGAAYGEDTAAIDLGDRYLVVNVDPLSLAENLVGTLAVHVACNDLAASGARPRWLANTIFLPDDDPETLEVIAADVDTAARSLDVAIVGGHTEYDPSRSRPLLCMTALGTAHRYVPSGGGTPGDAILMTGTAAIEGTAILATDFTEDLRARGVATDVIDRAASFIDEISVITPAMAVREFATGMHDPTEGGVLVGLVEMAAATGKTFDIDPAAVPVRSETAACCEAMDADPLRVFGSGALLVTLPQRDLPPAKEVLAAVGVTASVIGRISDGPPQVRVDGKLLDGPPRDDLYDLWE